MPKMENGRRYEDFWDGSKKTDGRSGCGVVIKGVDRNKCITVSKITVLLKGCAALAAEEVGVSVLLGILDLVLGKTISKKMEKRRESSQKKIQKLYHNIFM